jgi:hypothetical protein
MFQEWSDVDVLGFQIELCCNYFSLFLTWQHFGLFFEKFGNFFLIICGLYYKCFMIVIYDRNDSGQYYKTTITILIDDPS